MGYGVRIFGMEDLDVMTLGFVQRMWSLRSVPRVNPSSVQVAIASSSTKGARDYPLPGMPTVGVL